MLSQSTYTEKDKVARWEEGLIRLDSPRTGEECRVKSRGMMEKRVNSDITVWGML